MNRGGFFWFLISFNFPASGDFVTVRETVVDDLDVTLFSSQVGDEGHTRQPIRKYFRRNKKYKLQQNSCHNEKQHDMFPSYINP